MGLASNDPRTEGSEKKGSIAEYHPKIRGIVRRDPSLDCNGVVGVEVGAVKLVDLEEDEEGTTTVVEVLMLLDSGVVYTVVGVVVGE
jgi:hypothetical protein